MAFLKSLVIVMGILIVCGLGLLVYGIVTKTTGPGKVTSAMTTFSAPAQKPLAKLGDIIIPGATQCRIVATQISGNILTLTLGGIQMCHRVVVIDLTSGAVAAQVRLSPAP